jgi:hypothetical protein
MASGAIRSVIKLALIGLKPWAVVYSRFAAKSPKERNLVSFVPTFLDSLYTLALGIDQPVTYNLEPKTP